MDAINLLRRMWEHTEWADQELWPAVATRTGEPVWKEYLHVLGAEEVWLSRLEGRPAKAAVWPDLPAAQAEELRHAIVSGYRRYLGSLTADVLVRPIAYTNSAGLSFTGPPSEILAHVCLHGQYHRGKMNLMLRQATAAPVPVDFIAFARGVPAAVSSASDPAQRR